MLKSTPLRTPLNPIDANRNKRLSFSSLSKEKNNFVTMSEANVHKISSPRSMLTSHQRNSCGPKVDSRDQYCLFSNLIKKKEKEQFHSNHFDMKKQYSCFTEPQESEYWNVGSTIKQTKQKRGLNQKKIVERIFGENESKIIQRKARATCNSQKRGVLRGEEWTETDLVNTSEASVQFDMSPYLQ